MTELSVTVAGESLSGKRRLKDSNVENERIRSRILVPLGLALLVLLGSSVFSTYRLQRRRIDNEVREDLEQLRHLFELEVNKGGQLLNGLTDFIKEDHNLQKAWLAKDRETLLDYSRPILEKLRSKHRVTHFYFLGLDRVCFLRVHKPSRRGDYIERFTLAGAQRDGKPVYGIELGPLGTFTLRAVHPWWIDGKLVGFIELGIDVEGLALNLKETLGGELLVVIEKPYLQRGDWEEGMKMLGRQSHWEQFADFVVVEATTGTVPPALTETMKQHHEGEHKKFLFGVSLAKRQYRSGFVPLFDAGSREVGEIIYMDDVTEAEASLRTVVIATAVIYVVISTALFGFFYIFLGRLEYNLVSARRGLEITNKQLEEETASLRQTKDELSEEIEQRTLVEDKLRRKVFELEQAKQTALMMMKDAQQARSQAEQAEQALRVSEQRYRALFESSPDGILIADIRTRAFKYANPAICTMLGYTEAELKDMTVGDIHPKEALDYVTSEYDAQARGEKTFAENVPCLRKDGTTRYANVNTIKMLVDGQGCEIGFFRDVSPQGLGEGQT